MIKKLVVWYNKILKRILIKKQTFHKRLFALYILKSTKWVEICWIHVRCLYILCVCMKIYYYFYYDWIISTYSYHHHPTVSNRWRVHQLNLIPIKERSGLKISLRICDYWSNLLTVRKIWTDEWIISIIQ